MASMRQLEDCIALVKDAASFSTLVNLLGKYNLDVVPSNILLDVADLALVLLNNSLNTVDVQLILRVWDM